MIQTAIDAMAEAAAEALEGTGVPIITDPAEGIPALAADQIILVIAPPTEITPITYERRSYKFEPALISPNSEDAAGAVLALGEILEDLDMDLEAETTTLETLQIGAGPAWPAAIIHTTITL